MNARKIRFNALVYGLGMTPTTVMKKAAENAELSLAIMYRSIDGSRKSVRSERALARVLGMTKDEYVEALKIKPEMPHNDTLVVNAGANPGHAIE